MQNKKHRIGIQFKLVSGIVMIAVILSAVLTAATAIVYRKQMESMYSKIAFDQATIASKYINGDKISEYYRTGEKDSYYYEVDRYLLNAKQSVGLEYFYVVVLEDDQMVYIWDAGEDGEEGVCELLDADSYYDGGDELMHSALAVDAENTILISNNGEYGYLASAYVAILDSEGTPVALASVDISMNMIKTHIKNFVLLSILITILTLAFAIIVGYYYFRKTIIKPTYNINKSVSALVSSNMENLDDFSIDVHTSDELEDLASAFKYMTGELSEYIKNLSKITSEKERIGAELDIATHIQASMLPCIFPAFPERADFDIYASMNPAKEVGGDFYDFFMVDETHLAIVVADVSGKGVPAALFMVIGKTLLKDHTHSQSDLGDVFTKVNELLCESNSEGLFITAFEGVLDLVTGEFRYVNAGHEMPFICPKDGEYKPYKIKPGFVLAGMEGTRYRQGVITLKPGDRIFQYTDGVTEATDAQDRLYGMERLEDVLNKNKDRCPQELLYAVKADIDAFVGEAPQFDDITMLGLEYKGGIKE